MRKCKRWEIYVNENWEENCLNCIFNNKKDNKCGYDDWIPGLKTGKGLTKNNG
ncbi:MAG: hypothetical protein V1901_04030 [Patescibacteria group bacterium]